MMQKENPAGAGVLAASTGPDGLRAPALQI
jgi:hypothetical protein